MSQGGFSSNTGTGLFGNNQNASTSTGLFGSTTTSAFGQAKPAFGGFGTTQTTSLFGQQPTAQTQPQSTYIFGQTSATTSSGLFGSPASKHNSEHLVSNLRQCATQTSELSAIQDNFNMRSLALMLQDLIQCPKCLNPLDTDHSLCKNGHGVCSSCKNQIDKCPSCEEDFILHKPILLNQILNILPKPCRYAERECKEIMITNEHINFCEFRTTNCKLCEWTGCLKVLIEHVREHHKKDVIEYPSLGVMHNCLKTVHNEEVFSYYNAVIFKNKIFWLYFSHNKPLFRIMLKLYYLPTSKPTKDYFLITSFKEGDIEFKCTCKAYINMDNGDTDLGDGDSYLRLPDSMLDRFIVKEEICKYSYGVKIITHCVSDHK